MLLTLLREQLQPYAMTERSLLSYFKRSPLQALITYLNTLHQQTLPAFQADQALCQYLWVHRHSLGQHTQAYYLLKPLLAAYFESFYQACQRRHLSPPVEDQWPNQLKMHLHNLAVYQQQLVTACPQALADFYTPEFEAVTRSIQSTPSPPTKYESTFFQDIGRGICLYQCHETKGQRYQVLSLAPLEKLALHPQLKTLIVKHTPQQASGNIVTLYDYLEIFLRKLQAYQIHMPLPDKEIGISYKDYYMVELSLKVQTPFYFCFLPTQSEPQFRISADQKVLFEGYILLRLSLDALTETLQTQLVRFAYQAHTVELSEAIDRINHCSRLTAEAPLPARVAKKLF